jgi:hypothetical protein
MNMIIGRRQSRLVLLVICAGLWLGARPAAGQIGCAELGDTPEAALDFALAELNDDFPIPVGNPLACGVLMRNFVKLCSTAVKDSVKCLQNLYSGIAKQRQAACKILREGDDAKLCASQAKAVLKSNLDGLKLAGEDLIEECEEDLVEDYVLMCLLGI